MYKIPRARFLPYIFTGLLLIAAVWAFTYHANVAVREQVFAKSAEQAKRLADLFEQNVLKIFRYGDTYLMMARRELSRHGEIGAVRALMADVPRLYLFSRCRRQRVKRV